MEELKKKIAEAMNCKFVGDYKFNEEELSEIYSYSGRRLREFEYGYINKISALDYEILFVAMVNSVKTWTSDEDTFWDRIAKKLAGTEICSQKLYHALTEIIYHLGERNKILYLNGTQKRYYSTILAHAFAPLQSTESFFELCWQIYCEDMAQNYDESDSIFQIVSTELSKRFAQSKSDEDFQLGSKIYNFRAGIKRLAVEQCDLLTENIRDTISAISKLFNSEPIENTYYYSLLLNWWKNKEANFGIEKIKALQSIRIVSDYSAIKPRYINENGTVYLTVPAFRLLNNIYECPWIEVYANDSSVYSEKILTRGSGLSMSTKAYKIELSKILSDKSCFDIRLAITHGGATIFDSKKSLERIFMLFNGEKEIFAQQCLPGNYQLYCRDLDFLLQYPTNIKKVNSSFFLVNAIDGDVIQSKKRTVLFVSAKQNRDIWIYADKKNDVKFIQADEEYAPSSEVIADGRLYTSRYIKKASIGTNRQDWRTGYIAVCDNDDCKTVNYSIVPPSKEGIPCISCGKKLKPINFFESIEPRSGFVAERKDKDVPMTKQEKNYRSEDYYIGNTSAKLIDKYYFSFNGVEVKVESTTNDSLMVKSSINFYVCPLCGYAVAADENIGEKKIEGQMQLGALSVETEKPHESLFGQYNCNSKKLERRSLHHVFNTDVAKVTFSCDTSDYKTMISVMYAILNAIAKDLNIERRDIKACLSQHLTDNTMHYSIIIYDAVPGGAGHSRRLVTKNGEILYKILMSALYNMKTCNRDPSCYNCLRSYENQKIHDQLDRHLAEKLLEQFVGPIEILEKETITQAEDNSNEQNQYDK